MSTRGKKPRSVEERRTKGNPGGRSLQTIIPAPKAGVLLCPMQVANNERAKAYWDTYLANCAPGHLSPIDAPLLAALCMANARRDDAEAQMDGNMLVQLRLVGQSKDEPPRGPIMQSPFLPIINRQAELARRLSTDLGLTPTERNRVGAVLGGRLGTNADRTRGRKDKAAKYFD